MKILVMSAVVMVLMSACTSEVDPSATTPPPATDDAPAGEAAAPAGEAAAPAAPPALPDDFTWTGRYLVPDLDVEVPFTWVGRGGDFQMVAGGEDEVIHFTNVLTDGQLFTLTYEWPDVPRQPCSHVGPFTVEEFNEGLSGASYVGRETLHGTEGRPDHSADHYRSTAVLDLPPDLVPELEGIDLRLPLMAGDIYVDSQDPTTFRRVLHFGLQNLYDPDLDEWIFIDEVDPSAGDVSLPEECAAALNQGQ